MKSFYFAVLSLTLLIPLQSPAASKAAESMQKKLDFIEKNGAASHPNETPTVFTEDEVNGYLGSELVTLPAGVQSVHVSGEDGAVSGTAHIDFDQIKSGRHSSNPMLLIFSGTHDVQVNVHAHGQNHQGHVHVDSVLLDGVEIPEFILQLFIEKYLQPKYPDIGIDSQFALPDKIDSAKIGEHVLTVIQK
jgi:hypothetical protein